MNNNIQFADFKVFCCGVELKGITSITYHDRFYSGRITIVKKKTKNHLRRLKTVAEIVVNKANLN